MLLRYFQNDFEIVPVAPVITGFTFVFRSTLLYYSVIIILFYYIVLQ